MQKFRDRIHALREIVDIIVKLKEKGIEVDIELIHTAEKSAKTILEGKLE